MNSSAYIDNIDNKKKDILVIGQRLTQWLEDTLTTEKNLFNEFYSDKKKFHLSQSALQWSK